MFFVSVLKLSLFGGAVSSSVTPWEDEDEVQDKGWHRKEEQEEDEEKVAWWWWWGMDGRKN